MYTPFTRGGGYPGGIPMPQTRFVTRKALALGLNAIVVVNKIDRPGSRAAWVVDQTFDLFDKLGASDAQLDFPVIYASALQGWASTDYTERRPDMSALFEAILTHVPPPAAQADRPLQLQISTLDYNSYVGRIGIGRIRRGIVRPDDHERLTPVWDRAVAEAFPRIRVVDQPLWEVVRERQTVEALLASGQAPPSGRVHLFRRAG